MFNFIFVVAFGFFVRASTAGSVFSTGDSDDSDDSDEACFTQVGSDIVGEEGFSGAVAIEAVAISSDGNRIVMGDPDNDGNAQDAGHARVYHYQINDDRWVQLGDDIDGETAGVGFGVSVAISGDGSRIVVGSINGSGELLAGRISVYHYQNENWVQLGGNINGGTWADGFGRAVAISSDGNRIVAGKYSVDGLARVYRYQDETWVQFGEDIEEDFESVDISSDGNRIVVGAPDHFSARVFGYQDDNWEQLGSVIYGEQADDNFGFSVAISGDGSRIVVGAPAHDGNDSIWVGHARVYQYTQDDWVQLGSDIDGDETQEGFGASVSISGDGSRIVVGSERFLCITAPNCNYARAYQYQDGDFVQIGDDIVGYAYSVDISNDGNRFVVGNEAAQVFSLSQCLTT